MRRGVGGGLIQGEFHRLRGGRPKLRELTSRSLPFSKSRVTRVLWRAGGQVRQGEASLACLKLAFARENF